MFSVIVWLVISFFSTFSIAYLYYKLTDSKIAVNFKTIIIYIIGAVMVVVIKELNIEVLNYIFYFVYFPVLFQMLNKVKFNKLVYYGIWVWFCGIIIDLFLILIISLVNYVFGFNMYNNPELISMLLTVLVSFILIFLSKFSRFKKFLVDIYEKVQNIKYYDLLLLIFAMFVLAITIIMLIYVKSLTVNILLVLVITLMLIMLIVLLRYRVSFEENEKYLNTLKENNDFYIKMEDENRVFKHNLIAKLTSIKSVSNERSIALIDDLIRQFTESVEFANNVKVIPFGLKGIIYQRLYSYFNVLNIRINSDIEYDVYDVLTPRKYNVLVEKMIIALNNAIEACILSDDRALVIYIYEDNNFVNVEIRNSFNNNVDLDMIGEINYSTKGLKRGLGLFSAFRNNDATLEVKIINNIFITRIATKKR